jgi:arylsulfatase A-like enzyme
LKALEETNQLDNTLVIFTGDHGEHLGDRRSFGKRSMHDSSARIPMLLRLPGCFEGGTTCDDPVSLLDIGPTLMALAEARINSHEPDGENLLDILDGNPTPRERQILELLKRNLETG